MHLVGSGKGSPHCGVVPGVSRFREQSVFALKLFVMQLNRELHQLVRDGHIKRGTLFFTARQLLMVKEPRDEVKGMVARSTFYMYDRYGLSMSRQQQQLLMAWDRQHPVTTSEKRWESRTAAVMGHSNPFVTGERSWTLGHKPAREGLVSQLPAPHAATTSSHSSAASTDSIIGNRNSHV